VPLSRYMDDNNNGNMSSTLQPSISGNEPLHHCADCHSSTAARSRPTTPATVAVMKFESSHPRQSCPIILHAGHKWRREGTGNTSTGKEVGNEDDDVGVQ
jgi:hypothetical protein